jgi:putative DNA primase/helicase
MERYKSKIDFTALMASVACRLWGEPTRRTEVKLFWGNQDARVVDTAKGVWHDHEHNIGGGVLALIERVNNCDRAEALRWLKEHNFTKSENSPGGKSENKQRPGLGRIVAEYEYNDEAGEVLFTVVRTQDRDGRKQFRPYRPGATKPGIKGKNKRPDGTWEIPPVRLVLFRLPELIAAVERGETICICEGEKDVLNLTDAGCVATTNVFGAGKWEDAYNESLRGANAVLLPDNDKTGRDHMVAVADKLNGVALSVRIVDLAEHWPEGEPGEKADVSDWLAADGTKAKLEEIVAATREWHPLPESAKPLPDAEESNVIPFELANLKRENWVAYERARTVKAKELGVRPSVLDKKVNELSSLVDENPEMEFLKPPEPWPSAVDCDDLLMILCETLERHIVFTQVASTAAALWVLHAHAHDAAEHSPNLVFSSPTPRCGKTTALKLLSRVLPKALCSANVSPAILFRVTETYHPTLVLDEADTMNKDNHELRGILNSGHERDQAFVWRCVGDDHNPKQFSTWAAKVVGLIGRFHPTLEDRSIRIEMKRRLPTEKIVRVPRSKDAFDELKRKCARFAADNLEKLREADPDIPEELNDRARDNWRPLLAIADAAGGDWPAWAREAAVKLSATDDDSDVIGVQLLGDIRSLFDRENGDSLSSVYLAEELAKLEDRPWPEFNHGKTPIMPAGVARLLKPFKVGPRKVTVSGRQVQGYSPAMFKFVFRRYLPQDGILADAKATKGDSRL